MLKGRINGDKPYIITFTNGRLGASDEDDRIVADERLQERHRPHDSNQHEHSRENDRSSGKEMPAEPVVSYMKGRSIDPERDKSNQGEESLRRSGNQDMERAKLPPTCKHAISSKPEDSGVADVFPRSEAEAREAAWRKARDAAWHRAQEEVRRRREVERAQERFKKDEEAEAMKREMKNQHFR